MHIHTYMFACVCVCVSAVTAWNLKLLVLLVFAKAKTHHKTQAPRVLNSPPYFDKVTSLKPPIHLTLYPRNVQRGIKFTSTEFCQQNRWLFPALLCIQ